MHAAPAATLPPEVAEARRFIPSLSAYAVDLLLRRNERQAARARLLAAEYLLDMAERRLFRQLGYSSVMHYGTHALGLSCRDVWDWLRVARALRPLPAVARALRGGRLSWSKVREIIRVATPETEQEWLGRARRLSCRELEAAVAGESRAEENSSEATRFGSFRAEEGSGREIYSPFAHRITGSFTRGISFCGRGTPRGTVSRTVGGKRCSANLV